VENCEKVIASFKYINIYKQLHLSDIMSLLEKSRQIMNELKKKSAQKSKICREAGMHDVSKGSLFYVIGTIQASIPVHGCRVGIKVAGYCPNCHTRYERPPTKEETQTKEYQEMARRLDTCKSVEEMLHKPVNI